MFFLLLSPSLKSKFAKVGSLGFFPYFINEIRTGKGNRIKFEKKEKKVPLTSSQYFTVWFNMKGKKVFFDSVLIG